MSAEKKEKSFHFEIIEMKPRGYTSTTTTK